MRSAFPFWRVALAVLGLAVGAGRGGAEEPVTEENWDELREKTFKVVWETVNEAYYDPTFGGVDWPAMREKYRAELPGATDRASLGRLLSAMLGELGRSHFAILPRQLAVFTPEERVRIGSSGVEVAAVEEGVAVSAVKAGQVPDIHAGDLICSIDRVDLESLVAQLRAAEVSASRSSSYLAQLVESRLRGAVGSKVRLRLRDVAGQERLAELTIQAYEGEWSEPMGDFPSVPVECYHRQDAGLVYLRLGVFARQAMKDVRTALKAVPADGGLIIDLRGNPGGISIMASGISGWLSGRSFLLATMHMRQGHMGFTVSPQSGAFLGPVAILIDGGSASTSEIMAAGLQEAGRARIFGETSAGAALPSNFKALPTGDLFQYAVANLQTPGGKFIEGRGVTPDETIRRTRADLLAGRDPVHEAARRWLDGQRRPTPRPPPP